MKNVSIVSRRILTVELKDHILAEADALFCRNGIKSVTMDDIARHLGMSKKTIYQYFKDKNDLVCTLIQCKLTNECCQLDQTASASQNAIEEFFLSVKHVREMFSQMNPQIFYDLQKYHPQAWAVFQQFRNEYLYQCIQQNLKKGVASGLYRKDIDVDVLSRMRIEQIDMVFNLNVFPHSKYNLGEVMICITEHFLYGISTLKGHELINQYKQIKEEN